MSGLELKPIGFAEACAYIAAHHRHHKPPQGHKFSVGAVKFGVLVGVACVGRPVARMADDGFTAEVIRLCSDGTPNVCSLLYGAAASAAKGMGYAKIITYTLASEPCASLRASGWRLDVRSGGGSWSRDDRKREDKHPLEAKLRWVRDLRKRPLALEGVFA